HLHFCQVICNREESWSLQTGCYGLAHIDVPRDYYAVDRRRDDRVVEVQLRLLKLGLCLSNRSLRLIELRLCRSARSLRLTYLRDRLIIPCGCSSGLRYGGFNI